MHKKILELVKNEINQVTCISPSNIAVVKYWGKFLKNEKNIFPYNESISVCLNDLYTITTIYVVDSKINKEIERNYLFINGKEEKIEKRIENCINLARENGRNNLAKDKEMKFVIESKNNFPTAAGLASSASGYSAVACCLTNLFDIQSKKIQSCIARVGSGSACRSVYDGWVKWNKSNDLNDILSSYSIQLHDENFWDSMRILILIVDDDKKKISSSKGMKLSVENSPLFQKRVKQWLPSIIGQVESSIEEKNSEKFFDLITKECENFMAVCEDTTPPLKYRNLSSLTICEMIKNYNKVKGKVSAGYTFDAGPNAIIFCEDKNVNEVLSIFSYYFPEIDIDIDSDIDDNNDTTHVLKNFKNQFGEKVDDGIKIKQIIKTKIGKGSRKLSFNNKNNK